MGRGYLGAEALIWSDTNGMAFSYIASFRYVEPMRLLTPFPVSLPRMTAVNLTRKTCVPSRLCQLNERYRLVIPVVFERAAQNGIALYLHQCKYLPGRGE